MIVLFVLLCILLTRGFGLISSGQFQMVLLLWTLVVMVLLVLEGCIKGYQAQEMQTNDSTISVDKCLQEEK